MKFPKNLPATLRAKYPEVPKAKVWKLNEVFVIEGSETWVVIPVGVAVDSQAVQDVVKDGTLVKVSSFLYRLDRK